MTYMWTDADALYTHRWYYQDDEPTERHKSADAYLQARLQGLPPDRALIVANPCLIGETEPCPNACNCGCREGEYACRCHPDLPEFPED
jgi:hypothetical protein